jgi:L-ribulose-5-phosphate 4-epimerase
MSAVLEETSTDAATQVRQRLIDAGKILQVNGQADLTRGHVSIRVPGEPGLFYMKPHSMGFDEITMENMVTCNLDGVKVAGGGRRHSEVFIHSEIYKARPDVNSVIHTHPTHAVALSATGQPLLPISQPSVAFYDGLPYYTDTIELIRSAEKGRGVAQALGPCKALLMRNHGVVVVGASVEESTVLAIMLENACEIQLKAAAAGGIGEMFAPEVVDRLYQAMMQPEHYFINFNYMLRQLQRG